MVRQHEIYHSISFKISSNTSFDEKYITATKMYWPVQYLFEHNCAGRLFLVGLLTVVSLPHTLGNLHIREYGGKGGLFGRMTCIRVRPRIRIAARFRTLIIVGRRISGEAVF